MLSGKMVLVVTTTLVHLAVLGSGALFGSWRIEDQVVEDTEMPEPASTFQRRGGKARHYWGKVNRGVKNFRRRRERRRLQHQAKKCDVAIGGFGNEKCPKGTGVEEYTKEVNRWSAEKVQRRRLARGEDAKINMLILMSDTGGGHRASAQALEAALEEMFPGRIAVTMVDIFTEHSRWPYSASVPAYQYAAKNPLVWRAMYEYARFPPTRYLNGKMLSFQNFGRFKEAMQRYSPDFVVSVHPLCQDLPLKVLNAMAPQRKRELPFVTVVTDLGGAHPTWFNHEVDKVFIASEAVMRVAFRQGLSPAQIYQLGLPIRPAFWKDPRPSGELREELGLEAGPPVAMVMGGGDGVGGMGAIATAVIKTLAKELDRSQVVVICGKNEVVKRQLEETEWPNNSRVIVRGFVSNMDEWMGAVDALVTKAGPGTIAEATIRGLPVMLSGYLPGQEEGNVPYVVNGGFGAYSKNPVEIGATVARWLKNPELLQKMKGSALQAARPRASYDIAREIADMLFLDEAVDVDVDVDEDENGGRARAEEGSGGGEVGFVDLAAEVGELDGLEHEEAVMEAA
ncbi:unnamed protein product [Pylaiella littoralis]